MQEEPGMKAVVRCYDALGGNKTGLFTISFKYFAGGSSVSNMIPLFLLFSCI